MGPGKSSMKQRTFLMSGAVALAALSAPLSAQVPPQDRSTAGKSAAEIDEEWQKAGAKYDAARETLLATARQTAEAGPFQPDWETLAKYETPEWFKDAKFGIFIHWGVYAVPAFTEWYPNYVYDPKSDVNRHHVATYGPLTKFGYKDFSPMFQAEKFDPQAWARLFKEAGARYVVPVFEHHDGFAMYDSGLSDWTAAKMGPHRDLMADLAVAIRGEGLRLGASSHRIEHDWFFANGRLFDSDVNDPAYAGLYGPAQPRIEEKGGDLAEDWTYVSPAFARDWLARNVEIVEKYHPDLFYFDWWIGQPSVRPYLAEFAAYYYNASSRRGDVGVINYKRFAMAKHSGVFDIERGQADGILPLPWQTDTSVGNHSWGYSEHEVYKTPAFIVQELADVVSKNGNLLLNIGPRADGTIPQEVQQLLLDVGGWLRVNGEAIYGTRPWTAFGEGPTQVAKGSYHDIDTKPYTPRDFRFTTKNGALYAIEMAWPEGPEAVIQSLGKAGVPLVKNVTLLGHDGALSFIQQADGLHLRLPAENPGRFAAVYKIVFADAAPGKQSP